MKKLICITDEVLKSEVLQNLKFKVFQNLKSQMFKEQNNNKETCMCKIPHH